MDLTDDDPAVEVLGLGAEGTLAYVVARRRAAEVAAAQELRGVVHWARLHACGPAAGAVGDLLGDRVVGRSLTALAATGSEFLPGLEGELRLAGEGAFRVSGFAVCELAAALGMSEGAGRAYVGQAVELADRLPLLFAAVLAGEVAAWKARKVAEQTIPLTAAAADYVDRHLAVAGGRLSLRQMLRCVEAAVLRHDPERAAALAALAAEGRGVWVEDRVDGTSTVNAVTSTPDARAFEVALDEVATVLGVLGDTSSRQVRRARAVGVLADPQHALDLTTGTAVDPPTARNGRSPTLHVHLHTDSFPPGQDHGRDLPQGHGQGVARVEGVGARSLEAVASWMRDLSPTAVLTVTPVVDLTDHLALDAYEIPDSLRAQVLARDRTCRFPWCPRTAHSDLDHTVPWVPPDHGGPPGQTATTNLTRLCRFHHRVKTHGGWTYRRIHDTDVEWTSPLGRTYVVDEHGTLPQD